MSDLADLIARVEKASGKDRNLDAALALFLGEGGDNRIVGVDGWLLGGKESECIKAAAYTASLDAVVALIERELPEHEIRIDKVVESSGWQWIADLRGPPRIFGDCRGANAALALLLAFLRAKQQEGAKG